MGFRYQFNWVLVGFNMSKKKIIKVKELWELRHHIPLNFVGKLKVAFKEGKKKKLKNFSVSFLSTCDCCGPILRVDDSKGHRIMG